MTPGEFIVKWKDNPLSEKAGAQTYFNDLCEMLGVDKPNDPDNYTFERGATRTGAGHGWADVWKRDCFAWENKGPDGDLSKALKQLMTYALALDNPPLLVVCNRALIEIHTHFTGTPSEVHTIRLDDVGQPENLQKLRWVFTASDKFRPNRTVLDVTSEAAGRFADLAQSIHTRGHAPEKVAHFLIQCLFSMFAEDAGLLPAKLFQRIVGKSAGSPEKLAARLGELFQSMQAGGDFMLEDIAWFNGGLFQVIEPIPLVASEVKALLAASNMNWSHIEPSIFGTMFERGLDPAMRSQLGANYTDPGTIGKIIAPVIVRPLAAEWEAAKAIIAEAMVKYHAGGKGSQAAFKVAPALHRAAQEFPGAGPRLRVRQLSLPRAAGVERLGAPSQPRRRGAGPAPTAHHRDQPGQRPRHRDQRVRRRAGARHRLDRRNSVDAQEWLRHPASANSGGTESDRVPRRGIE